jgi:hypothetical protein
MRSVSMRRGSRLLQRQFSIASASAIDTNPSPAPGGSLGSEPALTDYLNKVLNARVYDVAVETPLVEAVNLSNELQNTVLLKVGGC